MSDSFGIESASELLEVSSSKLQRSVLLGLIGISFSMVQLSKAEEGVVLLHGLSRSPGSMSRMERYLEAEGYVCLNVGYASRRCSIEELANQVAEEIARGTKDWERVHFVTHSMGGILVRQMQREGPIPKLGRVVMIAPPNQGSEVVDRLGDAWYFKAWNGPAGQQLGTASDGFVAGLGPVDFELGVIAGSRTTPSLFDWCFEGEHDGKVTVERARVEGMRDFIVVPAGHTFISSRREVCRLALSFLGKGSFQ